MIFIPENSLELLMIGKVLQQLLKTSTSTLKLLETRNEVNFQVNSKLLKPVFSLFTELFLHG